MNDSQTDKSISMKFTPSSISRRCKQQGYYSPMLSNYCHKCKIVQLNSKSQPYGSKSLQDT